LDQAESCIALRTSLGNDLTIPKQISYVSGENVKIQTNVYQLSMRNKQEIKQYDVVITPEILNPRIVLHCVYTALCPDGGPMGSNERWQKIIFDGSRILYSSLPDISGTFVVSPKSKDDEDHKVEVKIVFTKTISPDNADSLLQIYNTAFHKAYKSIGLTNYKRKWLNPGDTTKAGNFDITKGFIPAISLLSSGLSYIVDLATRIDRPGTLYDYLREGIQNTNKRQSLEESVRQIQIQTTHRARGQKTITVNRVLWEERPSTTRFVRRDAKTGTEKEISIADYYREVYNIVCRNDDILIEMKSHKKDKESVDKYPSSVLKAVGISDFERRNGGIMRDIATVTRIDPNIRKKKLDSFIRDLLSNEAASSFFEQWGFSIGDSPLINGKIIPKPSLTFSNKNTKNQEDVTLDDTLGFQNKLRNVALAFNPEFKGPCLYIVPKETENDNRKIIDNIKIVSKGLGIAIPEMVEEVINNTHPNDYCRKIVEFINNGEVPCYVVCILPDSSKERYDGIKQLLSVQLGIPSQCVVASKAANGKLSFATNVAIQIASKTGGVPYRISSSCLPVRNTMLVGLSMTSGKGSAPVCAATATYDRQMTMFYSDSLSLTGFDRIIPEDFLRPFIEEALEQWKEYNNEYPKRIVVYREGVSYGQMPRVKEIEVKILEDVIQNVTNNQGSLIFIIAQKRGSIRIMNAESNSLQNAKPGTVITEGISANGVAEFYLISHHANQGSATPTRYTVIHHSPVTWTDDQIITLTHYMTLQYPNWSGSIRIPACLMLATRLAEMSKTHLASQKVSDRLKKYLHYL